MKSLTSFTERAVGCSSPNRGSPSESFGFSKVVFKSKSPDIAKLVPDASVRVRLHHEPPHSP